MMNADRLCVSGFDVVCCIHTYNLYSDRVGGTAPTHLDAVHKLRIKGLAATQELQDSVLFGRGRRLHRDTPFCRPDFERPQRVFLQLCGWPAMALLRLVVELPRHFVAGAVYAGLVFGEIGPGPYQLD